MLEFMRAINWNAVEHIGRVFATFNIESDVDTLHEVENTLQIGERTYAKIGDPIFRKNTDVVAGNRLRSRWMLNSEALGALGKDPNDHISALIVALLPWQDAIREWSESFDVSFQLWLESSYAYTGQGPEFRPDVLASIVPFAASFGCNVTCTSDHCE
jgi:hypothetical protein